MFQNPRRGKQEILQQMLQNSRSQIVFRTDIFGKLMLGALEYRYCMVEKCSAFLNGFDIHLNGSGYPFKKNCHPFERLGLSIWKKLLSVWTAWAIRLKKNVIRVNGLGCPFGKNCHLFERLGISVSKNCYPFGRLGLSVWKRNCRPLEELNLSVQR